MRGEAYRMEESTRDTGGDRSKLRAARGRRLFLFILDKLDYYIT